MFTQLRQQFSSFWEHQSKSQRIVLIALVATGLVLVPLFLVWASTPSYSVAFSGLSEADAGAIVEKLSEENTPYQLRGSGTILVPADDVYETRLRMARQGLPEGGSVGFELFSGSTLGMTEFTQRVNYQQAMEGELERTIGSMNAVDAVRVHIVTPEKTLLADEQAPATASITVKEKPGTHLDAAQVRSISHLVASSVEGLRPENVVIVDVNGNLLASGEAGGEAAALAQTDSRRNAEFLASRELQAKVQDLLDSALGPNKSVVQASVTLDWTQRETTMQSYDPNPNAVRSSTEVTETYTTTNTTLDGVPGAASNLPPAGTVVTPEDAAVSYSRTENTTNYEITQTETHQVEVPGNVKRISLSVLVDGVADTAQLETLRSVISAASGIDEARGDLLAVETLAFDRSYYEAQASELAESQHQDRYYQIGAAVAAAIVLLALLWYIQRLLKNLRLASAQAWTPVLKPVSEMALPAANGAQLQSTHSTPKPEQLEQYMSRSESLPQSQPQPEVRLPPLPKVDAPAMTQEDEQLMEEIQKLAEEEPASLASIIQVWLTDDEKGNV